MAFMPWKFTNELLKLGARHSNLEAKVFSGGNVMASFVQENVGNRNDLR
jgi:chemotaxis protein CheD